MGHRVRLFVGEPQAFTAYISLLGDVAIFRLRSDSALAVLPLDDDLHDRLHRLYGTGDWSENGGPLLSSSDQSFAARASLDGALGYVETDYFGGEGLQHAMAWRGGQVSIGAATMDVRLSRARPTTLWPINVVLRSIGVSATHLEDEFTRVGLQAYRSNEDVVAHAARAQIGRGGR